LRARAEESLVQELQDLQPEEAAVLVMLQRRLARDGAAADAGAAAGADVGAAVRGKRRAA
jgi:hypothetical protein